MFSNIRKQNMVEYSLLKFFIEAPPSMVTSTVPRVLRMPANTKGKDYVASDIHGAYKTLFEALAQVGYDPSCDRLFLDGDLIDRGEDSARCVEVLELGGVFANLGNHEDMLIDLYADGEPDEAVLRYVSRHNGFGWWMDASPETRQAVLTAVRKLPLVIEIETARGTVGLVHGDIPAGMDWPTFVSEIEAGNPDVEQIALWGRARIAGIDLTGRAVNGGNSNHDGVAGIGRVFVGHTPQWDGMQRFGNVYCVDSGAIFGETGRKLEGRLTLAELACKTQVLIAPKARVLIDIREDMPGEEAGSAPFGNYVTLDCA